MIQRKLGVLAACAGFALAAAALAQEKKMEMPKPGPEVKRLGYFVGTWRSEGEVKENPMMPAGKMTSTDKCEWFPGGFHVVCHSTGTSPMGASHGLGIMSWNPEEKAYTYHGIDSLGFAESAKGTAEGSAWTYTSEEKVQGKTVHGRYTMNEISPAAYTFKYESSEDGQNWATVMEGKSTKAMRKAPAKAAPAEKK